MARLIQTASEPACTLEECQAALDRQGFDPGNPDSVQHAAQWLARLAANRTFLGDLAILEVQRDCRRAGGQGYSPQVMMLGEPRPGWFMRANIWPSAEESVLHTSGEAAFVYGLAHDHNFDFLTVGYHGPGYASDHYEVDPDSVTGIVGEKVAMRFAGRMVLKPGQVMHYRARRDVHCQFAPPSLSVSINLIHGAAAQRWTDQFQYDLANQTIARVLTTCTGDSVGRMALALDADHCERPIARLAAEHEQPRLRWSALQALAEHRRDASILAAGADDTGDWLARRCAAAISD